MISSGSDNRKKKATRRQVLSLAGGATLALGTLGMMTFGAAATAYAQTPTATKTLTGSLTIGSPSAVTSTSPILSQSNPNAGVADNTLTFTTTADTTVTGTASSPSAAELTLSGPFALSTSTTSPTVAEVIDKTSGAVLGSLSVSSSGTITDQQPVVGTTGVNVYASGASTIKSGDTLEVIINNVANSTTVSSGDVVLSLGAETIPTSGTPTYSATTTATVITQSATIKAAPSPTLTLSPNDNPGQLTNLTYTFQVETAMKCGDSFTVDLTDTPVGGASTFPATLNTGSLALTVGGTSETSVVSPTYASGTGVLTLAVGSGGLSAGAYSITVPVVGSASPGIESLTAQYMGSAASGSSAVFVTSASTAAWGYPEDLKSVTASNPYAGASSTVTIDFTDLDGGTTPITVTGLGLSGHSYTLGTLTDTTSGANLGAVQFLNSSDTSNGSYTLKSGDSYSLTFNSVTLPSASTTVGVGTEFAPAASTTLSIGSSASTAMQVSASTTSPGVSSKWTLSGIEAATTLASGSTLSVDTTVSSGASVGAGSYSYLPTSASAYQVVDLSNSADTQTPSSVSVSNGVATFKLTSTIPTGDVIDVTISGVVNDPTASTATVSLTASGDYLEAAQLTAPSAASVKANGSIANASGALYEFAGGYAFHIPTVADAGKIEAFKSWPTQQKLSVPSTSIFASGDALTMGTLVQGVQSGTVLAPIYVVGSNGDLYHIASPTAFYGGGYSAKNVVEIPQSDLAMMTMASSGSATPSAASVHSNGSFWQASGTTTIYEWVGGVAVHVASPTDLVSIAHSMGETLMASWPQVSASSVPSSEMAPSVPMMGTVVKVLDGSSAGSMYVSTGTAFVSISSTQLSSLGYPMSDVLEVSTTAGISIL